MADLRSSSGRRPLAGVLAGAGGSCFGQPSAVWTDEDDPFADAPDAGDQAMSCWEELTATLDDELSALLATVPVEVVDEQPDGPVIASIEQDRLALDASPLLQSRDQAIDAVVTLDAREARLAAERIDALVQVHRLTTVAGTRGLGAPLRSLGLELGGSRKLGQAKVLSDVDNALRFTEVLPMTLAGLRAGTFNTGQAHAALGATQHCTPEVASEVEQRLFADPRAGLLNPSDLRRELARLVLLVEAELDPDAQAAREANAVDGRRATCFALPDGMAGLYVEMTAEQGLSHAAALDTLCRLVKADDHARGITRTATQRRVDVLAQLPDWVLQLLREKHQTGTATGTPPKPEDDRSDNGNGDGDGDGGVLDDTIDGSLPLDPFEHDDPDGGGPSPGPPGPDGASPPPVLLPTAAGPAKVTMNVHIPLATALGQSDAPAYLERHGWISAAQARRLMPHATLRPVHVDEHGQPVQTQSPDPSTNKQWRTVRPTGTHRAVRELLLDWARRTCHAPPQIIDTPEPQYQPSAALDRHLRERDLRCTGPGCSQPSHRCQLDHLRPYGQGGPTAAWNLGAKSTRCHNAKTHGGWTTTRHPDGSTTWTSPLHRRYWTPASWTAPPHEDPTADLPDPDHPRLTGTTPRRPSRWLDEQEDSAPGLRRGLDRRAAQDESPAQPHVAREPHADWLALTTSEAAHVEDDTPPPF